MSRTNRPKKFETRVVHAGQFPDPNTGAVMPPISLASTYAQQAPGEHKGYEYSRSHNPTRYAYERCIADLEGGAYAFAFASGMAAIATTLEFLTPGDHVLVSDDVYGGTYRLFEQIRRHTAGLDFTFIDMSDPDEVEGNLTEKTKMIWVESPSNPLLKLVDLSAVGKIARENGVMAVCDNTFATPILQQPLQHGFDIVIHSATKYLNGHSDMVGGVAVVADEENLYNVMGYLQNAVGAVASPFDCYLALRGMKTLALRMQRHCTNAKIIAKWLSEHPQVEKVTYPGLESHPQHALAREQMRSFGGMISFTLKADFDRTIEVLSQFKLITLAESLGGVESLIEHPASMTHAAVPIEQREFLGITDNLIRLSVGIEHVEDLQADIDQAITVGLE